MTLKTDDLISLLAKDSPVRVRLGQRLALALVVGILVSGAILLVALGLRHNLFTAIETVRVAFKIGLTLLLAVTATLLVMRIGKPGLPVKALALALLVPLGLLASGVGLELSAIPESAWRAALMGQNALFCLMFIPILSLVPLASLLLALRHSAPESPCRAGAACGLAASAIAAFLYAWHCPDDSPLFLMTWYLIAIAGVTALGGLLGRRMLRW